MVVTKGSATFVLKVQTGADADKVFTEVCIHVYLPCFTVVDGLCVPASFVQINAYEALSSVRPAVTLIPVGTIKLENVCEYPYVSGILLPYVDGVNLVWTSKWSEFLPLHTRVRMYKKMATVWCRLSRVVGNAVCLTFCACSESESGA